MTEEQDKQGAGMKERDAGGSRRYLDLDEEQVISIHGWAIRGVEECFESGMPRYAHTVGLHQRGLSELIVVGLPYQMAGNFLNAVAHAQAEAAAAGGTPGTGPLLMPGLSRRFYMLEVSDEQAMRYAPGAYERGEGKASFMQMCWSDRAGRFPWDKGFDTGWGEQPLLGIEPGLVH